MTQQKSEDEVQVSYVESMGDNLGSIFFLLYKEVVWVHAKWKEYRELFGTDSERIQLLNRNANFFFKIVQDGLWEDVLLHIARLTDSPKSMGKSNLTLQLLPNLIEYQDLRTRVEALLNICLEKTQFAKEHRHKRLAHKDLLHTQEPEAAPLSGISRAHVEEMLSSIRNLMNEIDGHYRDTTVAYDYFVANTGARRLISILNQFEQLKLNE